MVTSPAPNASRVARPLRSTPSEPRHTERTDRTERTGRTESRSFTDGRSGIVIRLELPDVHDDGRQPADHLGSTPLRSNRPVQSLDHGSWQGPETDLDVDPVRVARAVEELLRALAPAVNTRVRVEVMSATRPAVPQSAAAFLARSGNDTPPGRPELTDGLDIDQRSRTLTVDGEQVALTRREFDLLAYLDERRGEAFNRAELMASIWRTGFLDGDRTVDVHIRRIRMKLGRHAHRLSTLRGFGYRLD